VNGLAELFAEGLDAVIASLQDRSNRAKWIALSAFCKRDYWTRVWITQDIRFAERNMRFYSTSDEFPGSPGGVSPFTFESFVHMSLRRFTSGPDMMGPAPKPTQAGDGIVIL
jgi:hypothetical protein